MATSAWATARTARSAVAAEVGAWSRALGGTWLDQAADALRG